MEHLEAKFGVSLNSNYAFSPFSLAGYKAWRPVYVYGLDVTNTENPDVLFALYDADGERKYDRVCLIEFKRSFKIVVPEVQPKMAPRIALARCG